MIGLQLSMKWGIGMFKFIVRVLTGLLLIGALFIFCTACYDAARFVGRHWQVSLAAVGTLMLWAILSAWYDSWEDVRRQRIAVTPLPRSPIDFADDDY